MSLTLNEVILEGIKLHDSLKSTGLTRFEVRNPDTNKMYRLYLVDFDGEIDLLFSKTMKSRGAIITDHHALDIKNFE